MAVESSSPDPARVSSLGAAALAAGTYAMKKIQERRGREEGRTDEGYDGRI